MRVGSDGGSRATGGSVGSVGGRETGGGRGGSGVQMVGQRWLVRKLVAGRCRVDWQIRRKKECCKLRSKMPRRKKAARFRHGHVPAPTRLGLDGAARRTKTPRGERTPASPSISMGDGAHGAVQGLVADADSSITHRATCTLPWVCMAVAASRDARVESTSAAYNYISTRGREIQKNARTASEMGKSGANSSGREMAKVGRTFGCFRETT